MIGGLKRVTEEWRKVTNKSIADNLVQSIAELLDGKASYYICCDRTTSHKKIVIEYDHEEKMQALIYSNGSQECERDQDALE